MKNEQKIEKKYFLVKVLLWISVFAAVVFALLYIYELRTDRERLKCAQDFKFISYTARCEHEYFIDKKGYLEFKNRLLEYIRQAKKVGKAEVVAVRFRDLDSGPTMGVDDRNSFVPASLLKLPLAIAIYEMAEEDPGLLLKTITYNPETTPVLNQTFIPERELSPDQSYTIGELAERTILYSDNNSAQLLYQYLLGLKGENPLSAVYQSLGILEPGTDVFKAVVNAKDYGGMLRQLYMTSYLSRDYSEKLLSLLADSQFDNGLVAGVPDGLKVAHKFGERILPSGKKQLHDCGIIYYPGNPYQLCVMTEGTDFESLETIISDISKMTYDEFNSRNIINKK